MSMSRLREPEHRCALPMLPQEGEVLLCDQCGSTWIGRRPPNPNYHAWHRLTWVGRKLRRLP